MVFNFTEMDCERVRDIRIITRKTAGQENSEQLVFMNRNGVFRFDACTDGNTVTRIARLPFVKVWVFCAMVCDMLNSEIDRKEKETIWEISAHDKYGKHFVAKGFAVFNNIAPKYDPSKYLRHVTGLDRMWLLDGKV